MDDPYFGSDLKTHPWDDEERHCEGSVRSRVVDWMGYPPRICRTLHKCKICGGNIRAGGWYRDGGYGRRVHEKCAREEAEERVRAVAAQKSANIEAVVVRMEETAGLVNSMSPDQVAHLLRTLARELRDLPITARGKQG